jgi:hypothetical protein
MSTVLLVVRPFGGHARGDLITSPADIRALLASEHVHNVIRVAAPDDGVTGGKEG